MRAYILRAQACACKEEDVDQISRTVQRITAASGGDLPSTSSRETLFGSSSGMVASGPELPKREPQNTLPPRMPDLVTASMGGRFPLQEQSTPMPQQFPCVAPHEEQGKAP